MDGTDRDALGAAASLGRVAGAAGPHEALDAVAATARTALGALAAACHVADRGGGVRIHAAGEPGRLPARDRPLSALPGARGDVPAWEGATVGVRLAHGSVRAGGAPALLGVLLVAWDVPRRLTRAQREALRGLAAMASLVVANARLEEIAARALVAVERAAACDPLTGLPGDEALRERLEAEARRAGRYGRRLALALLDLDRLGEVDAAGGRAAGDGVIAETARLIAAEARAVDLVASVGGGRFAWVMPETPGSSAWLAAERARRVVGATAFPGAGRVTLAAGVADLEAAGTPQRLVALAEAALHEAKAAGGDVVERGPGDRDGGGPVSPR